MAVRVPPGFDFRAIPLDIHETFIRDVLQIDISRWAEFRHSIMIGNNAEYLHPSLGPGPVSEEIKSAYRELAKSHYEVIKSLGFARLTLNTARHVQSKPEYLFNAEKAKIDFYFHTGRKLDNLARLIYIIVDPNAAHNTNRKGYVRHWIDWSEFAQRSYSGYTRITRSRQLRGIINIRNVLTHGWSVPTKVAGTIHYWPKAIRYKRDFFWFYDERRILDQAYRSWIPVLTMMNDDYQFIEQFQNRVFRKLKLDIPAFERNNGVLIQDMPFSSP